MCNPGLYDYKDKGVGGTYQLFGLMMISEEGKQTEIYNKLIDAGFCVVQDGNRLQVGPNRKLMDLFQRLKYPHVPLYGSYISLSDAIIYNQDFMLKGKGEGFIITTCTSIIHKWKIGAEKSKPNEKLLQDTMAFLEEEGDKEFTKIVQILNKI